MVVMWLIAVILCLLIASGSALLALRIQYEVIEQRRLEREAWQQAQEGRQRTWEVRQSKHILETEKQIAGQIKDVRKDWGDWKAQIEQDQRVMQNRRRHEEELARLPFIEALELPLSTSSLQGQIERWQPPALYGADLRGRDLAHKFMGRADLREAQLASANLYMADLTEACLTGANLEQANLIGTNLKGADLRGANLSGANLLVADLHDAILYGATLLHTSNLSPEQLQSAFYDQTTCVDSTSHTTPLPIPGPLTPISSEPLLTANDAQKQTKQLPEIDEDLLFSETAKHAIPPQLSPVGLSVDETASALALLQNSESEQVATDEQTPPESLPATEQTALAEPAETLPEEGMEPPNGAEETTISAEQAPAHNNIIQLPARTQKAPHASERQDLKSFPRSNSRKSKGTTSRASRSSKDYSKEKPHQAKAN